jgi:tryptophanyl-tRNA synthetase
MALRNPQGKMSKSDPNPRSTILLSDSPEEIHEKFRFAFTDDLPSITYEPGNRHGLANMIQIIGHIEASATGQPATPETFEAIAKDFRHASFAALKEEVATMVANHLEPIRELYLEMMSEEKAAYLDDVAREGAEAARRSAAQTMRKVREAVGLWVD